MSLEAEQGTLWIEDADDGDCLIVSKAQARELLPLLQHFAETGSLPEPKP